MFYRYQCEAEIYQTLSRIPLHVRMKLDLTGLKISLKDWLAFSLEERLALCHLPVATEDERKAFCSYLDFLSRKYSDRPAGKTPPVTDPPWERPDRVPESVVAKSGENGGEPPVTPEEWRHWNPYQRYALYKLSISTNEPEQFIAVLKELRG